MDGSRKTTGRGRPPGLSCFSYSAGMTRGRTGNAEICLCNVMLNSVPTRVFPQPVKPCRKLNHRWVRAVGKKRAEVKPHPCTSTNFSRSPSSSTLPPREDLRKIRKPRHPRRPSGKPLRSWPTQQTPKAADPTWCSHTSGTRLFACRKPEPQTCGRIPYRHTRR
jgi:hypothetical protein